MRIDLCATSSFFILKILSFPYKFRLFILPARRLSSDLFHLPVCSFPCFKILSTIFSSKIMYINPPGALQNKKKRLPSSDSVSLKFLTRPTVSDYRYRSFDFVSDPSTSPALVFAVYRSPIAVTVRLCSSSSRTRSECFIKIIHHINLFYLPISYSLTVEERVSCLAFYLVLL